MKLKNKSQLFLFEELTPRVYEKIEWKPVPIEQYASWPFDKQLEYSIERDLLLAAKDQNPEWATYYLQRANTFKAWLNEL